MKLSPFIVCTAGFMISCNTDQLVSVPFPAGPDDAASVFFATSDENGLRVIALDADVTEPLLTTMSNQGGALTAGFSPRTLESLGIEAGSLDPAPPSEPHRAAIKTIETTFFSGELRDGAFSGWSEAGPDEPQVSALAKFEIRTLPKTCGVLGEERLQALEIRNDLSDIRLLESLPDGSAIVATEQSILHLTVERTLEPLMLPPDGAMIAGGGEAGPGALFLATAQSLYRIELQGGDLVYTRLGDVPAGATVAFAHQGQSGEIVALSATGAIYQLDGTALRLLLDTAAPGISRGGIAELGGRVFIASPAEPNIIEVDNGTAKLGAMVTNGGGLSAITVVDGLGLVVGDGFGQVFSSLDGAHWEKVAEKSGINVLISRLRPFRSGFVVAGDDGLVAEYTGTDFCEPFRANDQNIRVLADFGTGIVVATSNKARMLTPRVVILDPRN